MEKDAAWVHVITKEDYITDSMWNTRWVLDIVVFKVLKKNYCIIFNIINIERIASYYNRRLSTYSI